MSIQHPQSSSPVWRAMMAVVVMLWLATAADAQQQYTVAEIGTFGGAGSFANDVNNLGEVVGAAQNASGKYHAFHFSLGTLTDLGTLGGDESYAYAINNGQIVGDSQNASGFVRATLWSSGTVTDLGVLTPTGTSSSARDISSDGVVVGYAHQTSGLGLVNHAFRWNGVALSDLGTLGGPTSKAFAIDANGGIVGQADLGFVPHGCRFEAGGNISLTSSNGVAQGVSPSGTAVGKYLTAGHDHACRWSGTTLTDLGTLSGDNASVAYAINAAEQIVGTSSSASGSRAVIWNGSNSPTDLNTLIPTGSGWLLTNALSINDFGQIVGVGTLNGNSRGFVLSPLDVQTLNAVKGFLAGGDVTTNVETLGTGASSSVIGMTCDGVTRLLLRVRGLAGPGNVTFQITDENDLPVNVGTLRSPAGSENATTLTVATNQLMSGQHMAFAIFRAPNDFVRGPADVSLVTRPVKVHISYVPTGAGDSLVANRIVQLRRPPVLLLHGVNSNSDTWTLPIETDPRFVVFAQDYSPTTNDNFNDNVPQAAAGVQAALLRMSLLGYASVQADVVGHSMGGLLSRLYIANYNGIGYLRNTNYNAGFVNRLITLDTPHKGSPVAFVVAGIRDGLASNPASTVVLEILETFQGCLYCGALDDLRPNSSIITNLPVATIPAHAIVSIGGSEIIAQGLLSALTPPASTMVNALSGLAAPIAGMFPISTEHDLVVGQLSQEGGLPTNTGKISLIHFSLTPPPVVFANHLTNTKETIFSTTIASLLDESTNNASIYASEFPAASALAGDPLPPIPTYGAVVNGLSLTSPASSVTVHPGDTVTVSVSSINKFSPTSIVFGTPFDVQRVTSTPYSATVTVPTTFVGDFVIRAVGINAGLDIATVASPTIHVILPTTVTLTSVEVRPSLLALFDVMPQRGVRVIGTYSDGVQREITAPAFGTLYEMSNTAVATVDVNGTIASVSVGSALLTVSNGTKHTTVPVYVERIPCPADITDDSQVNIDDLLAVINAWGPCTWCAADITKNGFVNIDDLLAVINGWGICH